MFLQTVLLFVASYILGCFVAAYYVTRWRYGVDIRAAGSGNAGARNMARVYGWSLAILTLVIDGAKGVLAIYAGLSFVGSEWIAVAALVTTMIGHIWPVQLSFHGGKGVATGLGGLVALDPVACLALLAGGVVLFAITRDFFKSGLIAIGSAAPVMWVMGHDLPTVAAVAVASCLCLIVNHPILDAPRVPRTTPPP